MKLLNKNFVKTIAATTAVGAMACSAVPANAKERHRDKVSAGEVIAGAVIIGGLAAILSSKDKKDYNKQNRYSSSYNNKHNHHKRNRYKNQRVAYRRDGSRKAIRKCIGQAEYKVSHLGYADVTNIRDIKRTRYGYKVKGDILVTKGRGYNKYSDKGRFTCYIDSGNVSGVSFRGLGKNY